MDPQEQRLVNIENSIRELQTRRVNLNTDIIGLFEVVSAAPTGVPKDLFDQVKIYHNGTTYRLYWYDNVNHEWRYATGT